MPSKIVIVVLLACGAAAMQTIEAELKQRVRLDPGSFEANHRLGEFYAHGGNLRAAVRYLGNAYRIDPVNYDNGYNLALALLESGDADESRRVILALLNREDKSELHNLLGDVEEAAGNMLEAVRQYEIAARADPSEKNVFDLGSELLNHQGFQQAIQIFEFGAGRYPKSAKMRVGLGVAYYSAGRYSEAVESLCQAVDLDPTDVRALDFLGKMNDVSPELADEVTKRLARFAELYPDNASASYYYALSLRKRALTREPSGSEAKVEVLLIRAVKLNPQLTDAHYQLGLLYQDLDRPKKAIREYEAVVRARPDFKSAHYHLFQLYAAQGQSELARKELQIFRSLPDPGRDPAK